MTELMPFIIETVVVDIAILGVVLLSIWQVYHDVIQEERMRPLVICHYLMVISNVLGFIYYFDSQGGLGIYSVPAAKLITSIKSLFLIAAAHALAVGFIQSHKIVTEGPQRETEQKLAKVLYPLFWMLCLCLFISRCVTHLNALEVTISIIILGYNIVIGALVVVSAFRVRRVLMEEFKRVGKYSEGIRKLTRLIILVIIIVVVSDANTVIRLSDQIKQVSIQPILPDARPTSFDMNRILTDVLSVITLYAIVMGGWNAKTNPLTRKTQIESQMSHLTTQLPTSSSSPRRSTRSTGQGIPRSESSAEMATPPTMSRTIDTAPGPEPLTELVVEPFKPTEPEPEVVKGANDEANEANKTVDPQPEKEPVARDDNSSKRTRKQGDYEELCPI